MEDDSIQNVRESARENLKLSRRFQRDGVSDVQRSIKELRYFVNFFKPSSLIVLTTYQYTLIVHFILQRFIYLRKNII